MLALRFIGALFLLGAVIALTADVSRMSRAPQQARFSSLLKHWSDFAPQTLAATQKAVQTKVHPLLWDPVIRLPLSVPAWISITALAAVCFYAGRPRRRVEIFIN